jgi:hypothetical protein
LEVSYTAAIDDTFGRDEPPRENWLQHWWRAHAIRVQLDKELANALAQEIRDGKLVAEIAELAITRLAADLHVTAVKASKMLLAAVAQNLTPQGIRDALNSYSPPSIRSLIG